MVKLHQASFALYRLQYSKKNPVQIPTFLEEFPDFLTVILKENCKPSKLEDFNILWYLLDHIDTLSLTEILNIFNLYQLINFATQKADNTLD